MVAVTTRVLQLGIMLLIAFLAPGCKSCGREAKKPPQPAGRSELELVDLALRRGGYQGALAELEKTPEAALRAVAEQSAPPRSRKALFLAMMADHLKHVESYRAWQHTLDESPKTGTNPLGLGNPPSPDELISILGPTYPSHIHGLDGREHVYFWAERLLAMGGDTAARAAVPHLERIGTAPAIDALAVYVRTPEGGIALMDASMALGRAGRGRDLAEALAAYQPPAIPPTAIPGRIATVKTGFKTLSPKARTDSENEILAALEKEPLTADQRAGYLAALGAFGSAAAADRLALLRRTDWGAQMKAEIDAASAAILDRDEPPVQRGSGKP